MRRVINFISILIEIDKKQRQKELDKNIINNKHSQ